MGKRPEAEMEAIRREWDLRMSDPEYRHLSLKEKAAVLDVTPNTIYQWEYKIMPHRWERWREEEKVRLAEQEVKVNDALYRKALGGDIAGIKLWYQKRLGWSEKFTSENINKGPEGGMTDAELNKMVVKAMSKEDLEKALEEKELRVVEPEGTQVVGQSE